MCEWLRCCVTRKALDCHRAVLPSATRSPDMKRASIILPFVLLLSAIPTFRQGLGSIVGTVVDPSGAAIGSAKVTARQTGTNFSRIAISNADGSFVLSSLNPAAYALTIEASGFRLEKQNVTLLADQSLTVNVKMQLGTASQIVEVQSNTLQVDTSTSTLSQVIEQQRLSELPLNGRNAATLTLLVAGTVNSPNGGADQGATKT